MVFLMGQMTRILLNRKREHERAENEFDRLCREYRDKDMRGEADPASAEEFDRLCEEMISEMKKRQEAKEETLAIARGQWIHNSMKKRRRLFFRKPHREDDEDEGVSDLSHITVSDEESATSPAASTSPSPTKTIAAKAQPF